MPIFSEAEAASYEALGDLSAVTMEDLGLADITEIEEFTAVSRFLQHITELNQNQERAAAISDDISSALAYRGKSPYLYLLLRYKREYYWMLYDIAQQKLEDIKEDRLLDLIQCAPDTPIANVDPDIIEQHAQQCRELWAVQQEIEPRDEIERVCALYLQPEGPEAGFDDMLKARLIAKK